MTNYQAVQDTLDDLSVIDNDVENKAVTPKKLSALIRKALKNIFITVNTERSNETPYHRVRMLGRHYDDEDVPVRIIFSYNKNQVYIRLTRKSWNDFKRRLVSIIFHEFQHANQTEKRKVTRQREPNKKEVKSLVNREDGYSLYLIDPDELDAFAYQTAIDVSLGDHNIKHAELFEWYYHALKPNSYAMKRYLKKVYKYSMTMNA